MQRAVSVLRHEEAGTSSSPEKLRQLIALVLLPLLLGGCASLTRQMLYKPDSEPVIASWIAQPPEMVTARSGDGVELKGYFWPGAEGDRDVIIFFHGRNWTASRSAGAAQHLAGAGNAVLVASYRGFGDNPGHPSEDGMIEDAEAFISLARERAGPDARIWLIGHSIGAAVVLHAAADPRVNGVFALSAFPRMAAAAPRVARAFIPDRWDNVEALGTLHKPVIIMQGALDRFVPDDSGDVLFSTYKGPASLIVGEQSRHNPDLAILAPWLHAAIASMQSGSLGALPPPPTGWVEKVRRP